MARGNQRENDRAKAQKKLAGQAKPKESASSLSARREADALAMRLKEAKNIEKRAAAEAALIANGGVAPVVTKK